MTADVVEFEINRAMQLLASAAGSLAAVLVLRELAGNAPTLFYVSVPKFISGLWVALRDSRLQVIALSILDPIFLLVV